MPEVAGRHYSYSKRGKADADRAAKEKGVTVKYKAGTRKPAASKRTYT